jgi:hypothetical protein
MNYSANAQKSQEGIDPLESASTWKQQAGWAPVDVRTLRAAGASLMSIGLAAALISREEWAIDEGRLERIYSLSPSARGMVLRELVAAGFLRATDGGLYHVTREHRPT